MKKLTALLLTFIIAMCTIGSISASALTLVNNTQTQIEYLENGDYIETIITSNNSLISTASTSKTASKTSYYKNSSGDVMWSVTIKGTFSYNGTTSTCTSCSHSTTSPGSAWSIKSSSSSRSGNSATAKATATYTNMISTDYSMSVTIKCSANGTIS
jgi:hypothetical protein